MKMRPQVCPLGILLNTILNNKEEKMKKIIVLILIAAFLMISLNCTAIAANSPGPAPSSGDGSSDGPEWDPEVGRPDGVVGPGPAPNSGDGVSDGSGF